MKAVRPSRRWFRRIALGLAALVLGTAATTAIVSPASASLSSSFWDRMRIGGSSRFVTDVSGHVVTDNWEAISGQAWQFVQVVTPGFYSIYQIHAGDGAGCLAAPSGSEYAIVSSRSCTGGYSTMWQLSYDDILGGYRVANVNNGMCLTADGDYYYNDAYISTCKGDLYVYQGFVLLP
jgi:hypothetical protein